MKHRVVVAAALSVALLGAAGCGSSSNSDKKKASADPKSITVWLQVDAQKSWPQAVDAATTAFKAKHPNTEVKVEYQSWADHLTKLDAAIAGTSSPDVVELGNTEMTKYMAAGAFADLTSKKGDFDNSGTWLKSLEDSATYNGKLLGVPYYAGSRAIIYNKALFTKAGITKPPTTMDEFKADADKLVAANAKDSNFSALYFPGKYWYAAMSFVYDAGGQIAKQDGDKWTGTLDSPEAQQGLNTVKDLAAKYSKADKTGDEAKQDAVFAQGHVAMIYANAWEKGVILDPKTGNPKLKDSLGAFPMPSTQAGKFLPAFLGGSDLAVPLKSQAVDAAADWIKAYTSTPVETTFATVGKSIPNATALASTLASDPDVAPFADAAKYSWFVPTAKNWATVEKNNTIPNMLVSIFTGKASVADASKKASDEITSTLNAAG